MIDLLVAEGFLCQTPSGGFIALPNRSHMLKVGVDGRIARVS